LIYKAFPKFDFTSDRGRPIRKISCADGNRNRLSDFIDLSGGPRWDGASQTRIAAGGLHMDRCSFLAGLDASAKDASKPPDHACFVRFAQYSPVISA
jgi:hypothetical protein